VWRSSAREPIDRGASRRRAARAARSARRGCPLWDARCAGRCMRRQREGLCRALPNLPPGLLAIDVRRRFRATRTHPGGVPLFHLAGRTLRHLCHLLLPL
jgi:hypothetical protein